MLLFFNDSMLTQNTKRGQYSLHPLFISLMILFSALFVHAQDWQQTHKIGAIDKEIGDIFGISVAIDGNYAIVGAFGEDYETEDGIVSAAGAAFIFKRDLNGDWLQVQKLIAADPGATDFFGYKVTISGDYALVGAYLEDEDAIGNNSLVNAGSVYIFKKEVNGSWGQIQKIVASDRKTHDNFGWSVSISGDFIVIGTHPLSNSSGAAYIFKKETNGNWIQTQKIVASDQKAGAQFGVSVSIDEDYIVVGADSEPSDPMNNSTFGSGAAYIFQKGMDDNWMEIQKIIVADQDNFFGNQVAIDGDQVIISAPFETHDTTGNNSLDRAGAAYIFKKETDGSWVETQKLVAADREAEDYFGWQVSISGNYALIGTYYEDHDELGSNPLIDAGSAYIFKKETDGSWRENQKIIANDRGSNDQFSIGVGISGNYAIIGAGYDDPLDANNNTLTNAGSAYIFFRDDGLDAICSQDDEILLENTIQPTTYRAKSITATGTINQSNTVFHAVDAISLKPGFEVLAGVDFYAKIISCELAFQDDKSTSDLTSIYVDQNEVSLLNATDINLQLFPNPVINDLQISFILPESTTVSIDMYDLYGHLVMTSISNQPLVQGYHQFSLNTEPLSTSIYYILLTTNDRQITKKFVVQRE